MNIKILVYSPFGPGFLEEVSMSRVCAPSSLSLSLSLVFFDNYDLQNRM